MIHSSKHSIFKCRTNHQSKHHEIRNLPHSICQIQHPLLTHIFLKASRVTNNLKEENNTSQNTSDNNSHHSVVKIRLFSRSFPYKLHYCYDSYDETQRVQRKSNIGKCVIVKYIVWVNFYHLVSGGSFF
eukprot:NODE_107_length_18988_cov_0.534491.p18 type:complete len:129 gc:universal NODE_107_length_18988_cov_0.534491:7616-7230(-)